MHRGAPMQRPQFATGVTVTATVTAFSLSSARTQLELDPKLGPTLWKINAVTSALLLLLLLRFLLRRAPARHLIRKNRSSISASRSSAKVRAGKFGTSSGITAAISTPLWKPCGWPHENPAPEN